MHLLAMAALWLADVLSHSVRIAGTAALVASVAWQLRASVRNARITGLELRPDGSASVRVAGDWRDASLAPGGVALPWLVVVPLRFGDGERLRLVLLPDSADADDLRRLRMVLRWRAGQAAIAAASAAPRS
jgi:toxin CptA